ncbi:hypothetical protein [Patulibacter minatonensis]|uniref:hypothetical protein n=1 Tax=Patulibacter minatonensis TaxID=298163 RepID=UPI00047EC8AC|nr:hypothetical protein [Patulibacter minatonensis]
MKAPKLPSGFGRPHDYGPKGGQAVLFYLGVMVVFLVTGYGMRENNVIVIAIGIVLALMLAKKVKVWYTPKE